MPADQQGREIIVKLVSIFHGNKQAGIPSHQALICLFDPQTGTPLSFIDGNYITALRTAGSVALSTKLLASTDTGCWRSSVEPVIRLDWLSPGMHVTSVGYAPAGGELLPQVIAHGHLFVETRLAFEPPLVGCWELAGLDPINVGKLVAGCV